MVREVVCVLERGLRGGSVLATTLAGSVGEVVTLAYVLMFVLVP